MMRVLVLILFCLSIYVPTASAELYQNRDYNFQINIPDGWSPSPKNLGQYYIGKTDCGNEGEAKQVWAQIFSFAEMDTDNIDSVTTKNLTPQQRKDFLNSIIESMNKKYPTAKPLYSTYMVIGNNDFLVGKFRNEQQIDLIFVTSLFHRTEFFCIFTTNDPTGQYEQQFFDMLKTLRPIVGDSDGDFEEEIMYMHDIAEKEAISQITGESVTIVK